MSCIYLLFNELNQIVQQPVAQIQDTDNLSNKIAQQPVAQLGEASQTLSANYHSDVCQIEESLSSRPLLAPTGLVM